MKTGSALAAFGRRCGGIDLDVSRDSTLLACVGFVPVSHGSSNAAIDVEGRAGANAGFVIGDDGVAVIDSFCNTDAARDLLTDIRKLTSLPIRYVINTHYHIDHTAGNEVYHAAGALIVAQRNVHDWIRTENLKFFEPTAGERAMISGLLPPEILFNKRLTLLLGNRRRSNRRPSFPGMAMWPTQWTCASFAAICRT